MFTIDENRVSDDALMVANVKLNGNYNCNVKRMHLLLGNNWRVQATQLLVLQKLVSLFVAHLSGLFQLWRVQKFRFPARKKIEGTLVLAPLLFSYSTNVHFGCSLPKMDVILAIS
jgi:hypothetical protein